MSSKHGASATLVDHSVSLAAGAWAELGVSGWSSTHGDWAIDPEPLIVFTAWLGDADPRLRDEVTDWWIKNWRHVSKARLKNLLRAQPDDVHRAFGEFAATVGAHIGQAWPGATKPRRFTKTGRSSSPPLDRPSAAWLRLRAIFGVGARAEILRCFLSTQVGEVSVARLAAGAGYTKRNVADECFLLARAGVLSMKSRDNRFQYALARRAQLEAFVGELPPIRPNWVAMLNVVRELVALERRAVSGPQTLPVHARSALTRIEGDLDELALELQTGQLRSTDLWPAVHERAIAWLGAWASGRWRSHL